MIGNIAKFSHQVFFWLRHPHTTEDLNKLLAGIRSLAAIETVRGMHIGLPAPTGKDAVVDNSFSASALLFFDGIEDERRYQVHPLHEKFIAEHASLWSRVVVFDSISCNDDMDFGL